MNQILQQIIDHKRIELTSAQHIHPISALIEFAAHYHTPIHSMRQALRQSSTGIIAEFKRKSPSKGWIAPAADPTIIVPGYEQSGASAASILTDNHFFGGSLSDLQSTRPLTALPLLRKEFILSDYQLYEARSHGADVVLLIAACLSPKECEALTQRTIALGMEVLLEVHSEEELKYINPSIHMVGVNNRDLNTFVTDINTSLRLADAVRKQCQHYDNPPLLVSESGISSPSTVRQLRNEGYEGFLMGETFMRHSNPAQALADFTQALL